MSKEMWKNLMKRLEFEDFQLQNYQIQSENQPDLDSSSFASSMFDIFSEKNHVNKQLSNMTLDEQPSKNPSNVIDLFVESNNSPKSK
jgi:hypothetical protein